MYYQIIKKRNLGADKKVYPKKYYAKTVCITTVTTAEICKAIETNTSFSYGEVKGVLGVLANKIRRELLSTGKIRIKDLGTFKLAVRSTGANSREEFKSHNLRTPKLRFYPSKVLNEVRTLTRNKRVVISSNTTTSELIEDVKVEDVIADVEVEDNVESTGNL